MVIMVIGDDASEFIGFDDDDEDDVVDEIMMMMMK